MTLPAPRIKLGFLVGPAGIVADAYSILLCASAVQDVNAAKTTFERVSTVTDPVTVAFVITVLALKSYGYELYIWSAFSPKTLSSRGTICIKYEMTYNAADEIGEQDSNVEEYLEESP